MATEGIEIGRRRTGNAEPWHAADGAVRDACLPPPGTNWGRTIQFKNGGPLLMRRFRSPHPEEGPRCSHPTTARDGGRERPRRGRPREIRQRAELTDAAIARIEARDGPINAVVVRDFDSRAEQARQVDLAVAKGAALALAGVPMTVKSPSTWRDCRPRSGSRREGLAAGRGRGGGTAAEGRRRGDPGQDQRADRPSDYQSDNPIYGRTNNRMNWPVSGGSSGGRRRRWRRAWSPWSRQRRRRLPSACPRPSAASRAPHSFEAISLEGLGRRGGGGVMPRRAAPGRRRADGAYSGRPRAGVGRAGGPGRARGEAYRLTCRRRG